MNQHSSRKSLLLELLHTARAFLCDGDTLAAQQFLWLYRSQRLAVPASTRRRWKCGR